TCWIARQKWTTMSLLGNGGGLWCPRSRMKINLKDHECAAGVRHRQSMTRFRFGGSSTINALQFLVIRISHSEETEPQLAQFYECLSLALLNRVLRLRFSL